MGKELRGDEKEKENEERGEEDKRAGKGNIFDEGIVRGCLSQRDPPRLSAGRQLDEEEGPGCQSHSRHQEAGSAL